MERVTGTQQTNRETWKDGPPENSHTLQLSLQREVCVYV